jgi:hypothetical protein
MLCWECVLADLVREDMLLVKLVLDQGGKKLFQGWV